MHLTPEQKQQVEQAKARGERRTTLTFTSDQRRAWCQTVEAELGGKDENLTHARKVRAAAEKAGFIGDVRRAILLSRKPIGELAKQTEVEPHTLSDFCAGEADLPTAAIDRLMEALGLRLMQEIPR